ncbi:MAG: hypothetical protein LPJ89_11255, partial [Hymenobacteraceae bacterium]|nr:hypothetical protein [Hymenobacteraceae bacterium]MDX5396023.1 hypothetical protein [Hymenobacteraceae bacterium]MDX5444345.1 hypothetical protein [Hymenobacteraceae bacterium]MDX5512084.1 hypothetical protein [Hymenobacteraceae bacterium]
GHKLLGGVFTLVFPLQPDRKPETTNFWIWNYDDEKALINNIYNYFTSLWKDILKIRNHASLITAGISIARADIPYLYAKSLQHQIDSPEHIYDCFFNLRTIDLNVLGVPYFKTKANKEHTLYPKTKNDLLQRFEIEGTKQSGSSVWELFDNGDYKAIENRTVNEVAEIQELYNKMYELIGLPSDLHTLQHILQHHPDAKK